MRRVFCLVAALLGVASLALLFAQTRDTGSRIISLPTSKNLAVPAPGVLGPLNGFTPTIAISPDQHHAALLNDGYGTQANQAHQSIAILDLATNQLTDFPDARLGEEARQSYFIGLAFSTDGDHLYASMGSITDATGEKPGDTGNGIAVYKFRNGKISPERFLKIPPQEIAQGKKIAYALRKTSTGTAIPYAAGFAVIAGRGGGSDRLLVADNYADNVVLLDSESGRILKTFDLSTHAIIPSEFPYTCAAARDGVRAWCSLWNASRVVELDLEKGSVTRVIPVADPSDPAQMGSLTAIGLSPKGSLGRVTPVGDQSDPLRPGSHPTALLLSPDEKLLYVALSNKDAVGVVSTADGKLFGLLGRTMREEMSYPGIYPTALAQSADGKRLFVAESSVNAVAVFDVSSFFTNSENHSVGDLGLIPTEWYPTALATVGDDLLIATSKGKGTGPNSGPGRTSWERRHHEHPYIPTLLYGSIARINFREAETKLSGLTRQVENNNLYLGDTGKIEFRGGANPIHHVIYIIKENRTYDQVLGDLQAGGRKIGNGDPSLTMYGADVTPNEHKLALQFGVLDNFYDSGEVSGDGHNWSMAAITTDYNEKTWQIAYRGKERTYDFQGTVADELPLENNEPDIDAPATGFIWDNVALHGLTYRDYGEFVSGIWCKREAVASPKQGTPSAFQTDCPKAEITKGETLPPNLRTPQGSTSPWPWPVPMMQFAKATKVVLRDHIDPSFPDFNTEFPDQFRADEFLNEFEGFVQAKKEAHGTELPAFVLLYLPNDHTHGLTPGKPRPAASVADNDLAVGRVVEAVSHSPYWDDTAIFILEDDAQDGGDHVDAHRSIAFVISKYSPGSTQQPFVDSRFYTTVNMIHTLETLLGLPPMNQNDAYAPVMAPMFSGTGDQPAFTADWSNRENGLIYEMNPGHSKDAAESEKMDFSRPDANNAAALNAILWRERKGDAPMPAVKHSLFAGKPDSDGD